MTQHNSKRRRKGGLSPGCEILAYLTAADRAAAIADLKEQFPRVAFATLYDPDESELDRFLLAVRVDFGSGADMTNTNQRGYRVGIVGAYLEPTESDAPDTIKVQVVHTLTGDTWSGELEWCGVVHGVEKDIQEVDIRQLDAWIQSGLLIDRVPPVGAGGSSS